MAAGILFSLLPIVAVLAVIGLAGYAFVRVRAGEPVVHLSVAGFLAVYVGVAMVAALIVAAVGGSQLVNAGLSRAAGGEFSYGRQHRPVAPLLEAPAAGAADEGLAWAMDRADALEVERLDGAFRSGLISGISLAVVGLVIFAIHLLVRVLAGMGDTNRTQRRWLLGSLLLVFGLVSLVALPTGIVATLNYAFDASRDSYEGPGGTLALAIAFTPIWFALIALFTREVRRA